MLTSCAIGIEQKDGSVRAIRCHYDGYPGGVGAYLAGGYGMLEKAVDLIDHGELRELR